MQQRLPQNHATFKVDEHTRRFIILSEAWVLFFMGMATVIHVVVNLLPPFQALSAGFIDEITASSIVIEGLLVLTAIMLGVFNVRNRVGTLILMVTTYYLGDTLLEFTERPTSFTYYTMFWYGIVGTGIIALLLMILRFIGLSILWSKKSPPTFPRIWNHFRSELKRRRWTGLALLAVAGSMGFIQGLTMSGATAREITIEPQAGQIEFRMWANYYPAWYLAHPNGTQMLDQLDRHGVTIQCTIFPLRDADGQYESFSPTIYPEDVTNLVGNLTWFNENYPGIKFQYYAFGLGHGSNGNYEGSIYTLPMLKRFVDVCRAYPSNLSNVVGTYTDWEGPSDSAPDFSNETMNGWHQALWTDAMAYARAYFPDWTFSCCYPDSMHWDGIDGDDDLQYYHRYNVFNPAWDDYGPMVYRSCNAKETRRGRYDSSWMVYTQAKGLLNGALDGDVAKASMWLGCTGCGPYRNDTVVYEHGAPMNFGNATGFDALARDILILKHFGYKSVSIFHAIERFDTNPELTGFFYQYGFADALDRLNETVNGPNSTKSFTIWTDDWTMRGPLAEDAALNFNRITCIPLVALIVMVGAGLGLYGIFSEHTVAMLPRKKRGIISTT